MSQQSTTARQCGVCLEDIPGGTERVKCSQCQARIHKSCFDNANQDSSIKSCPVCKSTPSEKEDTPCYYCGVKFKKSSLVKATGSNRQAYLLCPPCMTQAQKDMEDEEKETRIRLERAEEEAKRERIAKKAAEDAAKKERLAQKTADDAAKKERLAQKTADDTAEKERLAQKAIEDAKKAAEEAAERERQTQKAAEDAATRERLAQEAAEEAAKKERLAQKAAEDARKELEIQEERRKAARAKEIRDALAAGPSGYKPSSSSSRARRGAIDEKIRDIEKEAEALTKILEESKKKMAELMDRRSAISSSEIESSEDDSLNRTGEWAKKLANTQRKGVKFSTTEADSDEEPQRMYPGFKTKRASTPKPYLQARTHDEFIESLGRNNSIFEKSTSRERTLHHNTSRLTLDESIARQGVSHSLPHFSGNAMEWPEFIHDYVSSTIRCNFSDVENAKRLREALKGDALRLVRTKLMFPEKVNESIAMLRLKYGRPDQILDSLVEKVNNIPPVEADDLNGIVDLTIVGDDIISILQASGMEEDMRNAKLLRDFVKKLRPVYRMQWGFQRNTNSNIKKFHKWLLELAYVAAEMADSNKQKSKRPVDRSASTPPTSKRNPAEAKRFHHVRTKESNQRKPTCDI